MEPPLTIAYHVSARANRDSILAHGIDWTRGEPLHADLFGGPEYGSDDYPQANYLFGDRSELDHYAWRFGDDDGPADIWQVDLTAIREEPWPDPQGGNAWTLDDPIPASALRLLNGDLLPAAR
jgi:hypothetical protein